METGETAVDRLTVADSPMNVVNTDITNPAAVLSLQPKLDTKMEDQPSKEPQVAMAHLPSTEGIQAEPLLQSTLPTHLPVNTTAAMRHTSGPTTSSMVPLMELQASAPAAVPPVQPSSSVQDPRLQSQPHHPPQQVFPPAAAAAPRSIPAAPQQPDQLVNLLLRDTAFLEAVRASNPKAAAICAVNVFKAITSLPQLLGLSHGAHHHDGPSPSRRQSQDADSSRSRRPSESGRRGSDGGRIMRVGERVIITHGSKRMPSDVVGKSAVVDAVETNGWVNIKLQSDGRPLHIQQRYLSSASQHAPHAARAPHTTDSSPRMTSVSPSSPVHGAGLHDGGLVGPAPPMDKLLPLLQNFPDVPDMHGFLEDLEGLPGPGPGPMKAQERPSRAGSMTGPARSSSLTQRGANQPALVGRGVTKAREVVKTIRKEMMAMEEAIPWNAVDARWRGQRASWRRSLRGCETVVEVSMRMQELHQALSTDKTTGVFASSGPWENSLQECLAGRGGWQLVQQCWAEMHHEVRRWLQSRSQAASSAVGQASHANAARAAVALEAAAELGEEYMDQVPLEAILNNQKDSYIALRSVIERERTRLIQRLEAIAQGNAAALVDDTSERSSLAESILAALPPASGRTGGHMFSGDLLDMETDAEAGSEATDMEDD